MSVGKSALNRSELTQTARVVEIGLERLKPHDASSLRVSRLAFVDDLVVCSEEDRQRIVVLAPDLSRVLHVIEVPALGAIGTDGLGHLVVACGSVVQVWSKSFSIESFVDVGPLTPSHISPSKRGGFYVTDPEQGVFLWDGAGPGLGHIYSAEPDFAPRATSELSDGRIVVVDGSRHVARVLHPGREEIDVIGLAADPGSSKGRLFGPKDVCAADDGGFFIADTWTHQILRYSQDLKRSTFHGEANSIGSRSGRLNAPMAVAYRPGAIACGDRNGRIILVRGNGDVKQYGSPDTDRRSFYGPRGLALSGDNVIVADTYNNRLVRFPISAIGGPSVPMRKLDLNVTLSWPRAAVAAHGVLWICDARNSRVLCAMENRVKPIRITLNGRIIPLVDPHTIHATPSGVLITDTAGQVIEIYPSGQVVRAWSATDAPFQIGANGPFLADAHDADLDHLGRLWIADTRANAIVVLNPDGTVHGRITEVVLQGVNRPLRGPRSVRVYRDVVLVCDSGNQRVLLLNSRGRVMSAVDSGNLPPSLGSLEWPRDALMLPDGSILISDYGNSRLVRVPPHSGAIFGTAVPQRAEG